jgi:dTDP-4-dehydrorhamnose reductase
VPTTVAEFAAPVRRPLYSVLDNAALRAAGLDRMRPWREALAEYMRCRVASRQVREG